MFYRGRGDEGTQDWGGEVGVSSKNWGEEEWGVEEGDGRDEGKTRDASPKQSTRGQSGGGRELSKRASAERTTAGDVRKERETGTPSRQREKSAEKELDDVERSASTRDQGTVEPPTRGFQSMTFSLTADKRLVVSSESGGGSRGRGRGGGRGKGRGGGGRGRGRGRGEKDDGDSLMVGASRTDHRIAPKPPPKETTSTTAAAPVEPKQTKQVSATLEKSEVKPATPPKPPSSPDQNTDGASRETGEEREGGGQPLSGSSPSDRTGAETSEMASKRAPTPPPTTGSQSVSKPKRYSSRRKTGIYTYHT